MAQQDFLTRLAEQIIILAGLGPLTDEQKKQYLPTLVSLLEERIGLELMPLLDESGQERFAKLAGDQGTTAQSWQEFWSTHVPDFEERMMNMAGEFIKHGRSVA